MLDKPTPTSPDFRRFVAAAYSDDVSWRTAREVSGSFARRTTASLCGCFADVHQRNQTMYLLDAITFGVSRSGETITSGGYETENAGLEHGVS